MKFDLICKDLNADNVRDVLDLLQPAQGQQPEQRVAAPAVLGGPTSPMSPAYNGPAPVVTPPAPPAEDNNAPGDLDARGFPWHEKIHSSSADKTAAGVWKKKRGVDENLVTTIEAELRAAGFGRVGAPPANVAPPSPVAPVAPSFTPPPVAPGFAPPAQGGAFPAGQPAPGFVQTPNAGFAPQAPAAPVVTQPAPRDFAGLMARVSQLFQTQSITPDYLASLNARIGQAFNCQINAITDISANQAMIDYAFQLMQVDGKV